MNRQPYCLPPRWWEPKMTPWWVRMSRGYRRRQLEQNQSLDSIDVTNGDLVRQAIDNGKGVLITPNHSVHYDAPCLYVAMDRFDLPLYFLTAWQMFGMATRFERFAMQRLGCFSIDREGTDRRAFKQAVQILQEEPHPLVIFPEGDIYHTTDFVTEFREGAGAIALTAAKRATRPIVVVPCGIKFWYLDDPGANLLLAMRRIEERLFLRADQELPLADRIHRLAQAALALKELDYLGQTREGRLRDRIRHLLEAVLLQLEQRHSICHKDESPPARVKALRQAVIKKLNGSETGTAAGGAVVERLGMDMEDLFFAVQLYSYRGDYLADNPTIERLAETVDKFEEDILGQDYPEVRGHRRVSIQFGSPIEVGTGSQRQSTAELTQTMHESVQQLIEAINDPSSSATPSDTMRSV
ncbi:MAG TPA: lysophospholipid acyltransferase family protein [Pirellulaceae bacterium]|nr:lysophospholipid acyltransferase family protein [Pirellulaceae bacterium]